MGHPQVTLDFNVRVEHRYDCADCGGQQTGMVLEVFPAPPHRTKDGGPIGRVRRCEVCTPADTETPLEVVGVLAPGTPIARLQTDKAAL